MDSSKLFAVITGDVAGSKRLEGDQRRQLLDEIHHAFSAVDEVLGKEAIAFPFEIFRGDSFQGVLLNPVLSLRAAIVIRASIRKAFPTTLKDAFDARIAIGIGTIDLLPSLHGGEGDGEAYRNSGPYLDKMNQTKSFLSIITPFEEHNRELQVEGALLDTIISRWTPARAAVVIEFFRGKTQSEIAQRMSISQPAVHKRQLSASIPAIELMETRFKELIGTQTNNIIS